MDAVRHLYASQEVYVIIVSHLLRYSLASILILGARCCLVIEFRLESRCTLTGEKLLKQPSWWAIACSTAFDELVHFFMLTRFILSTTVDLCVYLSEKLAFFMSSTYLTSILLGAINIIVSEGFILASTATVDCFIVLLGVCPIDGWLVTIIFLYRQVLDAHFTDNR